jgi:hypothetical protein
MAAVNTDTCHDESTAAATRNRAAGSAGAKPFVVWPSRFGITLADLAGMEILGAIDDGNTPRAGWRHWLFVRGDRAISCHVDIDGDGLCSARVIPLWSPEDAITEKFTRTADAVRWQKGIARQLHTLGWLLVEGRMVSSLAS